MAVLQIIYLVINIIGFAFGLVYFVSSPDFSFISDFFTFVSNRLGNIALVFISIIAILLFIPTLTLMTVILTFIALFSYYAK